MNYSLFGLSGGKRESWERLCSCEVNFWQLRVRKLVWTWFSPCSNQADSVKCSWLWGLLASKSSGTSSCWYPAGTVSWIGGWKWRIRTFCGLPCIGLWLLTFLKILKNLAHYILHLMNKPHLENTH